jgi:hypothetical protein
MAKNSSIINKINNNSSKLIINHILLGEESLKIDGQQFIQYKQKFIQYNTLNNDLSLQIKS